MLLHRVIEERVRNQEWSGRVKDTREKMNKLYDENRSLSLILLLLKIVVVAILTMAVSFG